MSRRYFVSYACHGEAGSGFGSGEVTVPGPIRTAADVEAIAEQVRRNKRLRWVTVLNFRPFED